MEADRWIERVVSQRSHLPELGELAAVEEELRAMAQQLRAGDEVLAPLRAAAAEAALESERLRARHEALRTKLDASTANARELTALQHELDSINALLRTSEDHELELMSELEPLEATRATLTANAQPLATRRGELRATIDALQATLDEELRALRADREQRATAVGGATRAAYDAALARVGGSGAAQVLDGRCDGCRIALSPLDRDRWRQRAHELTFVCPECGRVLLP
jgi:hypothetical protein